MTKLKIKAIDKRLTVRRLVRWANEDSDTASVMKLGTPEAVEGAIIVIKGARSLRTVTSTLVQYGLVTPGKPITDPMPGVPA